MLIQKCVRKQISVGTFVSILLRAKFQNDNKFNSYQRHFLLFLQLLQLFTQGSRSAFIFLRIRIQHFVMNADLYLEAQNVKEENALCTYFNNLRLLLIQNLRPNYLTDAG